MDPERFRHSPAGRLVRAGIPQAAYWAFVPSPLPPALAPDRELLQAASDAAYALGELAALGRMIANPHLLISPFLRREAVLSSRIEGTRADIADVYAFEAGQLPLPGLGSAPPVSDVQEVLNYVRALEYGLQRLETLPVSLRLIRELHERLMDGVRGAHATPGEFRRSQNWIGGLDSTPDSADYVPPPVKEMLEALDAFEKYLHDRSDDQPPLVQLAFIHYQFEAIHPFLDGNGRIGRLLLSLLLVEWKLLSLPLLYLSAYFERRRQAYYDLLLAVSEQGDWRAWVLFFLAGVAEQARDAGARAKQLQDLQTEWRQRLSEMGRSTLPMRLADYLFAAPILTIPQAQQVLQVTYASAQRAVARLERAGILEQRGESSYAKTYVAGEILDVIGSR